MATNNYDAIVIGAGIIGSSIGFQLTKHGVKNVLLLEKGRQIGLGSTGKSSAVLRQRYSHNEVALLAKEGLCAFAHWGEYLGLQSPRSGRFHVGVLWMMGEDKTTIEAEKLRLGKVGINIEILSKDDVHQRFPSFSLCQSYLDLSGEHAHTCNEASHFLFEPDGGYSDPVGANEDLLEAAKQNGALLRLGETVTAILSQSGRITGVKTTTAEYHSPVVINAAGPWCTSLYKLAGIEVSWDLRPTRIQVVFRDTPPNAGHIPVFVDSAGGIYGRPEARGGQILFGSVLPKDEEEYIADPETLDPSCDPHYRDEKLHALHHRIKNCTGRGNALGYSGLYTVNVQDMHPILGESQLKGFYLANGFSGHGFKLAPAVGSLMAQLITGHKTALDSKVDPKFFAIDRKPILLKTKNVLA